MLYLICFIFATIVLYRIWRHYRDKKLIESVTSLDRGERSERDVVLRLRKMGIEACAVFHDCYLWRTTGIYTQVDLVVATSCGLIVFEVKDYSGWIYGDSSHKYWLQSLAFGRDKHRFYSPIWQNMGHIRAIRENLCHNRGIPIYSVIVFYGDCKLKNIHIDDKNTFVIYPKRIKRTVKKILKKSPAHYGDKQEIADVLSKAVIDGENPSIVSDQREAAENISKYADRSYFSFSPLRAILRFLRWWIC